MDRTTREEQGRRADRSGLANRPQAVVYCRGQLRSPEVALVAVMTGRSMGRRGSKLACDPALASFSSTIFRLHLYPVRFFPARDQATLAREPQPVLFVELFQPSPATNLPCQRLEAYSQAAVHLPEQARLNPLRRARRDVGFVKDVLDREIRLEHPAFAPDLVPDGKVRDLVRRELSHSAVH